MSGGSSDLSVASVAAGLRTRLVGRTLRLLPEAGSTNDLALSAAEAGEAEGLCVLADRQTAGRGRQGRRWESPGGLGLYLSVLLRPPGPAARAPLLTLAAGVAAVEAVAEVAGLTPDLKWPNDLQLDGRKLAGILCELAAAGTATRHVVVGIGLNVHHQAADFPEALREEATSLRIATGRRIPRDGLAAALLGRLDEQYARFCAGELAGIVEAARRRCVTLGRRVEVQAGSDVWVGRAVDLDPDGMLLVQGPDGILRRVLAGDVTIRPATLRP